MSTAAELIDPARDREALATGEERNKLLLGLPPHEAALLQSITEIVQVASREVIAQPGQAIPYVHFPQTAVISLVTVLDEGEGIEALTVGNDGMTGLPLVHGVTTTASRVIGQVPGFARRTAVGAFTAALEAMPELRRRLDLYAQLAFDIVSQSSACNRMHVTDERCARWLLMSHDRAGRDEFELTQAFIAQMLGVRRPAVTVAIGGLERAGLVSHRRGRIRIEDRAGLEKTSCECYAFVKNREKLLLG